MKKMIGFATRILSLRLVIITLSLAQTTLWATALGTTSFGLVSTYLSAQVFTCLIARLAADNILVRYYKVSPEILREKFLDYLLSALLTSVLAGGVALALIGGLILRSWPPLESLIFLGFVTAFNCSMILSRILLAQKKQVQVSLFANALPVGISVALFGLSVLFESKFGETGHFAALAFLTLGYVASSVVFALLLRPFLAECRAARAPGFRYRLLLGSDQWHVLGYQTLSSFNGHGTTLAIAALFGPTVTGVFALANRFGSLLTYLNEPGRVYVMPIVPGKNARQLRNLYRRMLVFSLALGLAGVAFLLLAYALVPLPFPTDPPFELFATIIMVGAAVHVFAGPVGAMLAMSGNEKKNLIANLAGFAVAVLAIGLAAVMADPIYAVIGVAASMSTMKLVNTFSFFGYLRRQSG
ncbi:MULTISPECIES: lipopolysaccharide biosynthesis protein [Mameliella]|uniref:lipopolysaccharide biosynthesis protein n=1 Tax=Mameliella TaxID=1434019 RepID=UPI000B532422|nr:MULTISPECIES: hypothetical protein [Mameliella]MCR9272266.1 hypothetical protein [Paracoccaceae bacterium]OWV61703.1 hypothetical protein CDZ98_04150 [Mameliella alba]